jgi:hypothetical protein
VPVNDPREFYGLPLDRFVPERAALAKALRADGKREQAAEVAKLRKPSVAAWAVNQLVRTQRRAIDELFDAGDGLRAAQEDVVAGRGDADTLRQAARRELGAVDQLAGTARGLLSSSGHELSPAILERVRETLTAAARNRNARGLIADGCLERELRHVGLGDIALTSAPGKRQSGKSRARRENREEAGRENAERDKAARKLAADAARAVARTERLLQGAQERRDRAAAMLAESEERLEAALRAAEEAKSKLRSSPGS